MSDQQQILRSLTKLKDTEILFTSVRIATYAEVSMHLLRCTVRRVLNKERYFYMQARKKELLSRQDLSDREAFCRKVLWQRVDPEFWRKNIAFYLDGSGFQFKTNPVDQACAPNFRTCRKKQERLYLGCTAKGKNKGSVNANFMVTVARKSGIALCEQYEGAINGETFPNIVCIAFEASVLSSHSDGKRFLMDRCSQLNSKEGSSAIE